MVIDSLALKLHVGNKISKGELKRVISVHEEISVEDSGLPTKVRRHDCNIKYWKEGWIEEN